jgi:glycosyltransferase involved in cell wall biosynthesis
MARSTENLSRPGTGEPRVLLVVNSLGLGGTERMIQRMVSSLAATRSVCFTVCSLETAGPIGTALRDAGVEVIALGGHGGALRQVLGGAFRLRRLLASRRFDLLHTFLYRSHCAGRLARLGLRPRVPLLSSERCLGDNRGGLVQIANRVTSRMSDRILAVSGAVADRVVRRDGVPRDRVAVVSNGVEAAAPDERTRARLRRALGVADGGTLILYLGRLHPEKGPDVLVEALARLDRRAGDAWRAALVGGGEERDALLRRVTALGMADRVRVPGPRRRVGPWLDACDLLVLPSREEGMPVAALEAMMRSRAVVATRVGGTPEVVLDGKTGLLIPPDDPDALAAALLRLIADRAALATMGEAGRRRALAEFTIERMAAETLRHYRALQSPGADANAAPVAMGAG